MKKHPQLFKFIIILTILLTFIFNGAESFSTELQTQVIKTISATAKMNNSDDTSKSLTIPEKNMHAIKNIKKTGFKYTVFKFFVAMFCVLLSAIIIFILLKLYKKINMKNNSKLDSINYSQILETPKDFKEAINLFLDKTEK
jgi:hypothetical protein